jgi:hypothetical protein
MPEERIYMSAKEINRYEIVRQVLRKKMTGVEAATRLKLSERQFKRLKAAVIGRGPKGLIHGNRGKVGPNALSKSERNKIAKLLHEKYFDFKPTHASEKLASEHGINRDPKTIRGIQIKEGLWKSRKGKSKSEHREWRLPRAAVGELIQYDGSYEYWFENRAPKCCLLLAVDDATSALMSGEFVEDEGVFPTFHFWQNYLETLGKPVAIYTDKFSTYKMTQEVALNNHDAKTQFQRAMDELHINPIFADSPQAKGRVENKFKTLQDRLIKEMRLVNINTKEAATKYFNEIFVPWFNKRYAKPPRDPRNRHISLSAKELKSLPGILSRQKMRVVQNDFTVSYNNHWLQITKKQSVTVCKSDQITVEERWNGDLKLRLRGKYLNFIEIPKRNRLTKDVPWIIPATQKVELMN